MVEESTLAVHDQCTVKCASVVGKNTLQKRVQKFSSVVSIIKNDNGLSLATLFYACHP